MTVIILMTTQNPKKSAPYRYSSMKSMTKDYLFYCMYIAYTLLVCITIFEAPTENKFI